MQASNGLFSKCLLFRTKQNSETLNVSLNKTACFLRAAQCTWTVFQDRSFTTGTGSTCGVGSRKVRVTATRQVHVTGGRDLRTEQGAGLPGLDSRPCSAGLLLSAGVVICVIYSSVCLSIPVSKPIPLATLPPGNHKFIL